MGDGRKVTDLEVGWKIRLWRRRADRRPEIIEGVLEAIEQPVRRVRRSTRNGHPGRQHVTLRVRDDEGKNHFVHAGAIVKVQRVLGSVDSRRRAKDRVVA